MPSQATPVSLQLAKMQAFVIGLIVVLCSSSALSCDKKPLLNVSAYIFNRNAGFREVSNVKLLNLELYERIDVKDAVIPQLCEGSVVDMPMLQSLSLNLLGIEEIRPGAFRNVPQLRTLALSVNNITRIPAGVFNHLGLSSLYLSANAISEIAPNAFDDMPGLEKLYLDNNRIKRINGEWFRNTPNIQILALNLNQIEEIPPHSFKNLDTERNRVTIKLQKNRIKRIHDKAFSGTEYGVILQLAHNEIDTFSRQLYNSVKNMRVVDLKANQISCISDEILALLVNIPLYVNLDQNPISCECVPRFKSFSRSKKEFFYRTTLKCD